MLKNISQLKCIVNQKEFYFYCDNDSKTTEAKEALFQFSKYIGQIEDSAKSQQESNKIEEIKTEETMQA